MELKEKPPDKSRKRTDVADKLKARKDTVETVVKSALLKSIKENEKQKIATLIQNRVRVYSERMKLGSVVLSGIIKEAFNGIDDPLEAKLHEDLFDQTFIRQVVLGVSECSKPYPLIVDYYKRHSELLLNSAMRHMSDANIFTHGAKKYLTNWKTSFTTNFSKRMLTFTKVLAVDLQLSESERKAVFYRINGWKTPESFGCVFPERENVYETVAEHRRILGLEGDAKIQKDWLKEEGSLFRILRYFVVLNRYFASRGTKLFDIVPICRYGASFATIDSDSLYGIMRDAEMINCKLEEFKTLKLEHWHSIFNIPRYEGKENKFTGTIDTDGVSICFHFKRPKSEMDHLLKKIEKGVDESKSYFNVSPNDRVIGVDPGRTNIVYCVEVLEDGSFRKYKLTRRQYYNESGTNDVNNKTKFWNQGIQKTLQDMSQVTSKGTDVGKHEEFLRVFLDCYDACQDEYFKNRWARQRLRLYGGKKRVFARFFNKIQNDDASRRVVMAYGSAKFAPGGKNEVSVPTERAFKESKQRFVTIPVGEFRTTKVFNKDDSLLRKVQRRDNGYQVRGLLWCNSTNDGKFIDRDLNAAINIRRCVTDIVRPLALTRRPNLPPVPKGYGVVIKR